MNVEIFALCDAATHSMGKLNILGTFDSIFTRQIPATHPQCAVAIRIRFTRIEKGNHKIKLGIVDQDGRPAITSLDAGMQVSFPDELASHAFNLVLNIQGLKFEKYGEYSVDLAVDGRQEASLPLMIAEPLEKSRPKIQTG